MDRDGVIRLYKLGRLPVTVEVRRVEITRRGHGSWRVEVDVPGELQWPSGEAHSLRPSAVVEMVEYSADGQPEFYGFLPRGSGGIFLVGVTAGEGDL